MICTGVVVNSYPAKKPNGASWDTAGVDVFFSADSMKRPDLMIAGYPIPINNGGTFTGFSCGQGTEMKYNVKDSSFAFSSLNCFLSEVLERKTYTICLADYEEMGSAPYESLGVLTFNPAQGTNGEIHVNGTNGVKITIKYIIR